MRATDDARTPQSRPASAGFLATLLRRLTGRPAVAPVRLAPGERAARSRARLHVIGGPDPLRVHAAALELTEAFLARHERVLIVDGGRRLDLHERLGLIGAVGLVECLEGELRLEQAVTPVSEDGPWLLAHGHSSRPERWGRLGDVLDRALPQFDRVVLALDFAAPPEVGQGLAGRVLDGWWAEPHPERRRAAQAFSERLGIDLRGMEPRRIAAGTGAGAAPARDIGAETRELMMAAWAGAAPARVAPAPEPSPARADGAAATETGAPPPHVPATAEAAVVTMAAPPESPHVVASMDADARVRERLRFLMWATRMRAAAQSSAAPAPATPAIETSAETVAIG
jgi:hypothetical protein